MGLYRQGLGILEAQLGPEHPHVAMTLASMGVVAKDQVISCVIMAISIVLLCSSVCR